MLIDLVLCRHKGTNKPYLFQAPFCSGILKGDTVVVETAQGEDEVSVLAVDCEEVSGTKYDFMLMCAGAVHPLKRVVKKVTYQEMIYEEGQE